MKFVYYMEKISGIDIYGLTSLALFLGIFIAVLYGVAKADKKEINQISRIPLDKS